MSDYDFRPGGSLKLKGVAEGGVVKKKKKKSKQKADADEAVERDKVKKLLESSEFEVVSPPPSGTSTLDVPASSSSSKKTDAERRFDEIQRKRMAQRVAKMAHKTHKDRVSEFNAHLESLSEHHDIPKVGPG